MGLPFSVFSKIGLPGLSSPAGHVYDRHFKGRTGTFEEFHVAYVEFCKYLNTIMPGQDFNTPSREMIEDFYEKTWKSLDDDQKKKRFIQFMEKEVSKAGGEDLFIMVGVAASAAAIVAKRSCESVPQLKKFKLQYIPNVVFVPLCTLFAVMGATALKPKPT